jgi:group I intron endonuclease
MKNCIYKLTSPSGRAYIGQAKDFARRMAHYKCTKAKTQPKLHRAILKYGWDAFTKEVIDCCRGANVVEELNALETHYIDKFNCVVSGYNCLPIGQSQRGLVHTPETRRKISESKRGKPSWNKGIPMRPESKAKLSKRTTGRPGRPHTEETRTALSKGRTGAGNPMFGRKLTEEHISKCVVARTGKPGRPCTPELKAKLRLASLGKKHSEETKAKCRMAATGVVRKPFTPEHRMKLSEAAKNRKTK